MTRKYILYTVVTAAAISIIIVFISLAYSMKEQRVEAHRKSVTTEAVETQPPIGYTLKEYNGELAVFRGESETPFRLLGISISVMSDYDKEVLKSGIFAENESSLNRLIEDYTP